MTASAAKGEKLTVDVAKGVIALGRHRSFVSKAIAQAVLELMESTACAEDMEHRFSCLLDHATGGRLSKTNYTTGVMYSEVDAHIARLLETDRAAWLVELAGRAAGAGVCLDAPDEEPRNGHNGGLSDSL